MTAWLLRIGLAPVAMCLPWLIPAWQKKWTMASALAACWLAGWACTLWLWAGPGFITVLTVGLFATWATKLKVSE